MSDRSCNRPDLAHWARAATLLLAVCALSGCTFSSTARNWNAMYGPEGERVFVKTLTRVGFNAFVIVPFVGWTDTGTLVDHLTDEIRREDGDKVRLVELETTRFWLGLVPITFFVTPVVATIVAEYQPSPEQLARQEERERNSWFRTGELEPRDG